MIPTLLNWKAPGWSLRAMLALSVFIPLALFAWTAWSRRAQELEDAERTAVRTVTALHEHATRVLDTHEVVLDELFQMRSFEVMIARAGNDQGREVVFSGMNGTLASEHTAAEPYACRPFHRAA